ncbi:MAG: hypothetical protein GY820_24120 [Gammaproteobacteria bacterium]|nr:hypothetical protein [Gammaproteobacteria bacterium]
MESGSDPVMGVDNISRDLEAEQVTLFWGWLIEGTGTGTGTGTRWLIEGTTGTGTHSIFSLKQCSKRLSLILSYRPDAWQCPRLPIRCPFMTYIPFP